MSTIHEVRQLKQRLADVSDSPEVDVDYLLCHVLEKPASYLRTWPEKLLLPAQLEAFNSLLERRLAGEPIAYILGYRAFWDFDLAVSSDTLIPRADTEVLVETALRIYTDQLSLPKRVLDLGTGTGAIALALAKECPVWSVLGCDLMPGAVELAQHNQARLGVSNVSFIQSSWFDVIDGDFDLIVSNPPYIDPEDPHLAQGDVRFEPLSALIADDKGMADIRHIATHATSRLHHQGWLMFEHGYDQGEACRSLLMQLGYQQVETVRDYGDNDRVTLGQWLTPVKE